MVLALCCATIVWDPAHAQTAIGPLTDSDIPNGIDNSGLRGTGSDVGGVDGMADPASDSAQTPDQSDGKVPAQRRSNVKAPETSTAKPRQGTPKLPPLAPYPSSQSLRKATIDPAEPAQAPAVFGPTVAALPVTTVRRGKPDPTPFAPLGFTVGTLRFTPFVEESLGYDSNPDQASTGVKGSGFSRTEGGFDLLSLWSSNELRANMHAGYDEFFSDSKANRPDGAGTIGYRYDVSRDVALDAEGRFAITTQRPGSPELNAAVQNRPLISTVGTTVGGSDTFGRLTLGLHGSFDRTMYENGRLSDGTVLRLSDETYNDYGIVGRAGYELTPGFKPFVEVTGDTRVHDERIDSSGYARDSDGVLARVGSSFEFSHLVTGEASAGYEDRSYEDRRLKDLRGPLVQASVVYAMTPLTTLTLQASTSFDETNLAGSSGSESRLVSFQISHALLRNLTLTGLVSYLNTDYQGTNIVENTISGTLKASYNLGRDVVLDATYNHATLTSTAASSNYDQDVFMVGVRLQH